MHLISFLASLLILSCSGIQPRYHRVAAGESLVKIAERYEVPVQELERNNHAALAMGLKPGQKLFVPYEKNPKWNQEFEAPAQAPRVVASQPEVEEIPNAQFDWPAPGPISSGFGRRSLRGKPERDHEGLDIAAPYGAVVRASRSGHVIYASNRISGYGNMVIVKHADNFSTVYAHLSKFAPKLKKGKFVSRGERVGLVGRTGRAYGAHLHFEVRFNRLPVDPMAYLQGQYASNTISTNHRRR